MKFEPATKAIAKFNREIKASNKAFSKMSAPRRRVQIAKDVIAALKAEQLRAHSGSWIDSDELKSEGSNVQVQAILPSIENCDVCALGAVFACVALRKDRVTAGMMYSFGMQGMQTIKSYLRNEFSSDQLNLIEFAFEAGQGCARSKEIGIYYQTNQVNINNKDETRANAWVRKSIKLMWDVTTRMKLIMRNIVRNNGTFKP